MSRFRYQLVLAAAAFSLLMAGCAGEASVEQRKRFNDAEIAFQNADSQEQYLRVAGSYQQLRDEGLRSVAVLFNQGNAFARAEQHGHAIACYRQALRLEPNNKSIRGNLELAMNQTGAAEPPVGWVRRIMFWHGWLGYESRFYVATVLTVLTSLLLIVARRTRSWLASRVGLGLLLVSLAVVASAVYGWYRIEATQWGAVVADGVVPRTGNGANYGPAFNQPVPGGTEFSVSEQRGDWLSIVIPGVGDGWVESDQVVVY